MKISERKSKLPTMAPIKEIMSVFIPEVNHDIPCRRGFVYGMVGSGGSGKSSLLLSMFKSKAYYRNKFDNLFLFVPEGSYLSVKSHPFKNHEQVMHHLTIDNLLDIYDKLNEIKEECIENNETIETSLIIVDDMANMLKNLDLAMVLNKMIIKSRHLSVCWIFTLQSYNLMNLTIRKQFTNVSIFKPKNNKEWEVIAKELIPMSKNNILALYDYVFDQNYQHLDIDTVNKVYYKNFNELIIEE